MDKQVCQELDDFSDASACLEAQAVNGKSAFAGLSLDSFWLLLLASLRLSISFENPPQN